MSDTITHDQIHNRQRKLSLITSCEKLLNQRIEHGKSLPDMTPEIMSKLVAMRDAFVKVANEQPDEFFGKLRDVNQAMAALKPLVRM